MSRLRYPKSAKILQYGFLELRNAIHISKGKFMLKKLQGCKDKNDLCSSYEPKSQYLIEVDEKGIATIIF